MLVTQSAKLNFSKKLYNFARPRYSTRTIKHLKTTSWYIIIRAN